MRVDIVVGTQLAAILRLIGQIRGGRCHRAGLENIVAWRRSSDQAIAGRHVHCWGYLVSRAKAQRLEG